MKNASLKVVTNGQSLDDLTIDQIIGRPNVEFTKRIIPHFPDHKADNERPQAVLNRLKSLNNQTTGNNYNNGN